jgi:hypothetical protein
MKSLFKVFGIIALVAIIGFSFAACSDDDGGGTGGGGGGTGGGGNTTTYSLDGVWEFSDGTQINASGSTGIVKTFGSDFSGSYPLFTDAKNKGYIQIGSQFWRNLTGTGNLAWSGQELLVTWSGNSNNATGTSWGNCTFTMSADGQTLFRTSGSQVLTLRRVSTYSLDGVWEGYEGTQINVSGSTGVYKAFGSDFSGGYPLFTDAKNKGYIKLGDACWRNLTSTGTLTWSGQVQTVIWSGNNNNATGTGWSSTILFTLSANGQTLTVDGGGIWRRK